MANIIAPMPLLRAFIGLSDQVDDRAVEQIAVGVTARFQQICGRNFFRNAALSEYHDADGGPCFIVDAPPITSVTSIWVSPDATWDSTTLIDAEYYEEDSDTGVIWWRNYVPPVAERAIKITYVSGWELKNMPEALVRAFMEQVRHEFRSRDNMSNKRVTDAYGNTIEPWGFELLPEVRDTLGMYRLVTI